MLMCHVQEHQHNVYLVIEHLALFPWFVPRFIFIYSDTATVPYSEYQHLVSNLIQKYSAVHTAQSRIVLLGAVAETMPETKVQIKKHHHQQRPLISLSMSLCITASCNALALEQSSQCSTPAVFPCGVNRSGISTACMLKLTERSSVTLITKPPQLYAHCETYRCAHTKRSLIE